MEYFVKKESIVRQIWGKSDTILFIFAGAAAEFALNKAVDWLYFTGRLPSDPIGRFLSTVSYARTIVFSEKQSALNAIDAITAIHKKVESDRGVEIQDWAYRDVLFMLIDYSIRSYEVLERKLTVSEKREVFSVFHRMGRRMDINGLPKTLEEWQEMRQEHLRLNLECGHYTADLFAQYGKHLGGIRYRILLEVQRLIVPPHVHDFLGFRRKSVLNPLLILYKFIRSIKLDWLAKAVILPNRYKEDIKAMEQVPV